MSMRSDTIAAISTPHGKGAIGVIRVSGPDALGIVDRITLSKSPLTAFLTPNQRKLVRASLIGKAREKLDDILVAIMPPNRSYTGEILIELHCHGSELVLKLAMARLIEQGARLAEPGEFTRRALENDRLDLIQAEAINEIVGAQTASSLRSAIKNMDGALSKKISKIRDRTYEAYMTCQYNIDFDEELSDQNRSMITENTKETINNLNDIIKYSGILDRCSGGYRVIIHGSANSGKSTLFNALLKKERSIVDKRPGTTRDYISETIEVDGEKILLIDTAGTQDTKNSLTKKAMARSRQQVRSSELSLLVIDQSVEFKNTTIRTIKETNDKNGIVVFNKSDKKISKSSLTYLTSDKSKETIVISAKNGINIGRLYDKITECFRRDTEIRKSEDAYLLSERQRSLLFKITKELSDIYELFKIEKVLDIIAEKEKIVLDHLDDLLGKRTDKDTLEEIFKKFCVGK